MKKTIILSALSGLLTSAAFSFDRLFFLVFFSYIPLFIALNGCSKKQLKYAALIFSVCLYCPLLSFIYPLKGMLPVDGAAAVFAIFAVTVMVSCFQALLAWLPLRLLNNKKGRYALYVCPFLLIVGDWLQCINPIFAFPYASAAVCAGNITAFIQSASLFGSFFVSYLILLFNSFIAFVIMKKTSVNDYAAVSVLLFLNTLYGCIRLSTYRQDGEIKAVIVQGNQSCKKKWDVSTDETIRIYSALLNGAVNESGVAVFPETTVTEPINEQLIDRLSELSKESGCNIVMGAQYIVDGNRYNAVICIDENGLRGKPYFKRKLVLFGERIPFYDYLPYRIRGSYINFTEGSEAIPIDTGMGITGGIICYESMYPQLAREAAVNGADFLTVVSNDSWFEDTNAVNIHFRHSILRSVETGKGVLRCANTGISASISPVGTLTDTLPPMERTAKECSIALSSGRTLYDIVGDIFIYIFLMVITVKKIISKNT